MSTHNISFYVEIRKISIFLEHLIKSYGCSFLYMELYRCIMKCLKSVDMSLKQEEMFMK